MCFELPKSISACRKYQSLVDFWKLYKYRLLKLTKYMEAPAPLLSKEFVDAYVALIWVIFWLVLLFIFRRHMSQIVEAFVKRIQGGSSVKVGPVSIGEPPNEIRGDAPGAVAVSDPNSTATLPKDFSSNQLDTEYQKLIEEEYFLLHATEIMRERTTPKSGRYRVRVWIESYYDKPLDNIIRVTYRVWDDFKRPIISTTSRNTNFDVWFSIYGEFPVLALIERRDKPGVLVARYIDLPGRPPD